MFGQNDRAEARFPQAAQMDLPAMRQNSDAKGFAQNTRADSVNPPRRKRRMNLRTLILYWPTSLILSLAVAHAGPAPSGAQRNKAAAEQTTQELRKLTDDLKRLEPIIARLEKMRGIMAITRETSPTLEKLDKLMIKADLVERVNLLLERAEKIEPILRSLEEMQRDFAERQREKGGVSPTPV
jgi:hypothetical protein